MGVGQRKDTSPIESVFFLSHQKVTNRDFNLLCHILLSCPGSSSGDKCRLVIRRILATGRKEDFRHDSEMSRGTPFPSPFPMSPLSEGSTAEGVAIQADFSTSHGPGTEAYCTEIWQCRNFCPIIGVAVPGRFRRAFF